MNKRVKIIVSIIALLIIITGGFSLLAYILLNNFVPDYSGKLVTEGVSGEVEVYTDSFAVPYIFAENEKDAVFGLGYLHAGERMFQMDMIRRAGEGKLSEVFGERTIDFDKMFRTLDLKSTAEESLTRLDAEDLEFLRSYSNGINLFLEENKGNISMEFEVLGYEPDSWRPVHSMLILRLLAWELNLAWWVDIAFSDLIQKLGFEKVEEIIPDYPPNAPFIIADNLNIPTEFVDISKRFRDFLGITGTHIGSNSWVVSGAKSTSKKPLIANDPHLSFQVPGKWYLAVIKSGQLEVAGFTLPGIPGVIIGKNNSISWTLTNVMADDSDFYAEYLDSTGTKYMLDGEWRDLSIKKDTIRVKDGDPLEFMVKKTHRGPIISSIHTYNILYPDEHQDSAEVSMRWTAYDHYEDFKALRLINKAANWEEFNQAVSHFSAPGQNFVYADKNGNIGYICGVKIPIRNGNNTQFIYDGRSSANDWLGYVDFDEMPKLFNPRNNLIASANNKIEENFNYYITYMWEPPSRIMRIDELLSKEIHSVEDFMLYQNDIYSYHAEEMTGYVIKAFEGTQIKDSNLSTALRLLSDWNYEMEKLSQTPAIFQKFQIKLLENIFLDEMGESLFNKFLFVANVPYRSLARLLAGGSSDWFDDKNSDEIENMDEIIRKSLVEALSELEKELGTDIALWQWGELHTVEFKHFFDGISSLTDRIVNIGPFKIPGSGTTILNAEFALNKNFEVRLGPSMRFIYDFSIPGEFYCILPTGQSGHIMSDHYDDMTRLWLEADYIKIITNESVIKSSNFDLLSISPN